MHISPPSRHSFAFLATAFILMCAAAAVALHDRSHPLAAASPGQVFLDTHLVWTSHSFRPVWTPVPGPRNAYVWEREDLGYTEIDPAVREGRWRRVELAGAGAWGIGFLSSPALSELFSPVFGDGRFYTASESPEHKLFGYDLRLPPISVTRNLVGHASTDVQRPPAWERDLPRGSDLSGMTFDNGRLYVGVQNGLTGSGGLMVFSAADGRPLGSVPFPAAAIGPAALVGSPVIGRLSSGEIVVVAALCSGDGNGALCAVDVAASNVLWTAILEFHPIGPPAVGGGIVVIGGIGTKRRPEMGGFRLRGGKQIWRFESPHGEPNADDGWQPRTVPLPNPGRRQPGGVAVSTEIGAGQIACFACGGRMYAVDLATGRHGWELAPPIDPQAEKAVNVIANSSIYSPSRKQFGPQPGELPRAPWVTAPTFHRDELLFGTPDGLWAVGAADGTPRWCLRQQEVGTVDLSPLVSDDIVYLASQGWVGSDVDAAIMPAAYALRLDGPAVRAPTLTARPISLRHWPLLAAAAALAGLVVAAIERPRPSARTRRLLDGLAVLLVLAAASVLAGWACLHHPTFRPPQPGDSPAAWQDYGSPPPTALLCTLLALIYAGALVAVWRGQKLSFAATIALVLGAAVVTLWVRGRRAEELFSITTYDLRPDRVQRHTTSLMSGVGGLRIGTSEAEEALAPGLFKARDKSFSWSREFLDPAWYPVAGPVAPSLEKGTERQWHGFELQSRLSVEPISKALALDSGSRSVAVPDWSLLVAAAAIPAAWLLRLALRWLKRRRAAKAGRCRVCNYSLTGNISGICPECGTPASFRITSPSAPPNTQ